MAVLDKRTESLDTHTPVDVIYLDLKKAFDSVPHHCLLLKLESYGIESGVLTCIKDFLVGRRQTVCESGTYSDWSAVTSGVPPCSILGPMLFPVSINDLTDIVAVYAKCIQMTQKSLPKLSNRTWAVWLTGQTAGNCDSMQTNVRYSAWHKIIQNMYIT